MNAAPPPPRVRPTSEARPRSATGRPTTGAFMRSKPGCAQSGESRDGRSTCRSVDLLEDLGDREAEAHKRQRPRMTDIGVRSALGWARWSDMPIRRGTSSEIPPESADGCRASRILSPDNWSQSLEPPSGSDPAGIHYPSPLVGSIGGNPDSGPGNYRKRVGNYPSLTPRSAVPRRQNPPPVTDGGASRPDCHRQNGRRAAEFGSVSERFVVAFRPGSTGLGRDGHETVKVGSKGAAPRIRA